MAKLLHTDNHGDRVEHWWLHTGDDGNDRITIQTVEDVQPLLDRNKEEFNSAPQKFGKGTFHKVASIPATVLEEVCRIREISYMELMQNKSDLAKSIWNHMLNDSTLRAFRTRPGRV